MLDIDKYFYEKRSYSPLFAIVVAYGLFICLLFMVKPITPLAIVGIYSIALLFSGILIGTNKKIVVYESNLDLLVKGINFGFLKYSKDNFAKYQSYSKLGFVLKQVAQAEFNVKEPAEILKDLTSFKRSETSVIAIYIVLCVFSLAIYGKYFAINFNLFLLFYFVIFAFFGFSIGIKTGKYLYRRWIRQRINNLLIKNYQKFGNRPLYTDEELLIWLKNAIISKFTKKGESLPENYFFDCHAEIDPKYFEVGETEEEQEWLSWFPRLKDIVLYQVNQGKIQYIRPNTSLMGGKQPETIPSRRLEHIFIHQRYQCIIPIDDLEFFIKENGFKIDKDFNIHWQLLIGEKLLKNGFF